MTSTIIAVDKLGVLRRERKYLRAIKDLPGPQSCFGIPCKIAERTYFSGFLIIKPLFKLFDFAPSPPILNGLQWILSIFTCFDLVKPSGRRSGWPPRPLWLGLPIVEGGLRALYRAVLACFFSSVPDVLTIGPARPSAGRRADRGVNGPRAIHEPQAAFGVA